MSAEETGHSLTVDDGAAVSSSLHDPEIDLHPEELDAHLHVLDVRQRLRERRRRMIRFYSVVFIILVSAFLIGMGVTSKMGILGSKESELGGSGTATTGTSAQLPPPPSDLASRCSVTSLNTQQGIEICEEACEVAECCGVPDGYALSCLQANVVVCAQYQRYCDILQGVLDTAQQPSSGSGGGVNSGGGTGGGLEVDSKDPVVKVDIDNACVGKEAGELAQSTCMGLCQSGFCCFSGSGTCPVGFNCQTYINCQSAYNVFIGKPVDNDVAESPVSAPPPTELTLPEQIDQACGDFVEAINPPGESACETLCAPSECCFDHYCVPSPDTNCLDYSGCFVLYADLDATDDDGVNADGSPTLAAEIHTACFSEASISAANSNQECTSLCSPGACCFEPNLDCVGIDCITYAECNILYPSFLAVTREEVEDACNNHSDAANGSGPTLCEQVCTLHVMQCCFHENNGEGCDNVLQAPGTAYCNTYGACSKLGTSGTDLRDSHKNELGVACQNSETRSKCITLCSAATCCYATSIEDECVNVDSSITCSDYSACNVLYNS